jgi:predicted double-glycine peptidase
MPIRHSTSAPARRPAGPRRSLAAAVAAALAAAFLAAACLSFDGAYRRRTQAMPFEAPADSRLVLGLPFYPDESRLCGPASLAAVMNYMGYPVTLEEAAKGAQRWELRGSIGPDLVLWARSKGAKARFYSAKPEDLVEFVNKQIPVVVQVDEGIGPLVKGHFMVVAGYSFEGVVVNSGLVQQEVMDWSKFLTRWYKMGNFAIVIEASEAPAPAAEADPAAEGAPAAEGPAAGWGSPAPEGGAPAGGGGGEARAEEGPGNPTAPANDVPLMADPDASALPAPPSPAAASPGGPATLATGARAEGEPSQALAGNYKEPRSRPGREGY